MIMQHVQVNWNRSLLQLPVKQRVKAHGLLRFDCIVQSGRFVLNLYAMALRGSQAYACRVYRHTWCTLTRANCMAEQRNRIHS